MGIATDTVLHLCCPTSWDDGLIGVTRPSLAEPIRLTCRNINGLHGGYCLYPHFYPRHGMRSRTC